MAGGGMQDGQGLSWSSLRLEPGGALRYTCSPEIPGTRRAASLTLTPRTPSCHTTPSLVEGPHFLAVLGHCHALWPGTQVAW